MEKVVVFYDESRFWTQVYINSVYVHLIRMPYPH